MDRKISRDEDDIIIIIIIIVMIIVISGSFIRCIYCRYIGR